MLDPTLSPADSVAAASCEEAIRLQIAGRLDAAERVYRSILAAQPGHAMANHCLGLLMLQSRRAAASVDPLRAAVSAQPTEQAYWLGYLEALLASGRIDDAAATAQLGEQHGLAGPAFTEFKERLAAQSAELVRQAEEHLLGLIGRRQLPEALEQARVLTARFPQHGTGWKILGALWWSQGRTDAALQALQNAARLLPADAEAHSNLGQCLAQLQRFGEAETSLRQAVSIDPGFAGAHFRLSMAFEMQGRFREAQESLRTALSLRSGALSEDDQRGLSNLLYLSSHDPDLDAGALFAEHCRVSDILAASCDAPPMQHGNSRDPERRLRIGFVSGDLRDHAVALFFEPVLTHLRRPGLELHAYSNAIAADAVTRRLRPRFDHWRDVAAMPDNALAAQIAADRIDILLDLSGHTAMNRLRVFAHKPAPLQVSWLGYPGTTGLRTMDYYMTSRTYLPPGRFDDQFTEKLALLQGFAPFYAVPASPPIAPLPALHSGHLQWASFNRPGKLNDATLTLWSALLRELPDSQLLLGGIDGHEVRGQLTARFVARGIEARRVSFEPRCTLDRYLALHHRVDLCLDPLPYSGGTTACHALWMGVPTLTLDGATPSGRQGASIQESVELHAFVARDPEDFVAKGVAWSERLPELAAIRSSLRERWLQAPGRDPVSNALQLEQALRHMWKRWCEGLPAAAFDVAMPARTQGSSIRSQGY